MSDAWHSGRNKKQSTLSDGMYLLLCACDLFSFAEVVSIGGSKSAGGCENQDMITTKTHTAVALKVQRDAQHASPRNRDIECFVIA